MLAHVSIQCADLGGQRRLLRRRPGAPRRTPRNGVDGAIGYGIPPLPTFWIGRQQTGEGFRETHIAFEAPDRRAVRAFFDAALGSGAEALHEPRLWPQYHADYYGAFVRDPDGNNVEAVCHAPE